MLQASTFTLGYDPLPVFSSARPSTNTRTTVVTYGWSNGSEVTFTHDCGNQATVTTEPVTASDGGKYYGKASSSFNPFDKDATAASVPSGTTCEITATSEEGTLSIPGQYRGETDGFTVIKKDVARDDADKSRPRLGADPPKGKPLGTLVIKAPTPPNPTGVSIVRYYATVSGGGVAKTAAGVARKDGAVVLFNGNIAFNSVPRGESYWVCVTFNWEGGTENAGCWGVPFK